MDGKSVKRRTAKYTIEEIQNLANKRGGWCLSKQYKNIHAKLEWECEKGHKWKSASVNIIRGCWCVICAKKERQEKISNIICDIVKAKGGLILSEYKGSHSKAVCQCEHGHIWYPKFNTLQQGFWCPYCSNNTKHTIEEMQNFANKRGGFCCSEVYKGNRSKLEWECRNGHKWKAIPSSIIKGCWCPECSSYLSERACREILYQLTGYTFEKCRPKWLEGLELDGYCSKLNAAFEFDGAYHKRIVFPYQTKKNLDSVKTRDKKKSSICKKRGILLLRIDEVKPFSIKVLTKNIINKLKQFSIPYNIVNIDIKPIYDYNKLDKYAQIAERKGGSCVSKGYLSAQTKLTWMCANGHKWQAVPGAIWSGKWCPKCAKNFKLTIEDAIKLAKHKNGQCLSSEYTNNSQKLTWKCQKGHIWESTLTSVRNSKSWCPHCAKGVKLTIDEAYRLAKSKSGQCLSIAYENHDQKLTWKCQKEHVWDALLTSVKHHGTWCPYCARRKK